MATKSKHHAGQETKIAVLIACVDPRLHPTVQRKVKELQIMHEREGKSIEVMTLRTGGANFIEARDSVLRAAQGGNLEYMLFVTHHDCKAMDLVFRNLKDGLQITKLEEETLVKPFSDIKGKFETRKQLEELDGPIQVELAKAALRTGGYNPDTINMAVDNIDLTDVQSERKLTAYFATPEVIINYKKNPNMNGCPVFQGPGVEQVLGSLEAVHKAIPFGVLKLVAPTRHDVSFMEAQAKIVQKKIAQADGLEGIAVEVVRLNQ